MNEKRATQLLLVPYTLWQLTSKLDDHRSLRLRNYVELFSYKLLPEDKKRLKISKRTFKHVRSLMEFTAKDGMYSGHKVVLILRHLTQAMFNSHEDLKLSKEHYWLKKIYFILDFVLEVESKERIMRLGSDEAFEKLENSARKQALKIYELIFKNI